MERWTENSSPFPQHQEVFLLWSKKLSMILWRPLASSLCSFPLHVFLPLNWPRSLPPRGLVSLLRCLLPLLFQWDSFLVFMSQIECVPWKSIFLPVVTLSWLYLHSDKDWRLKIHKVWSSPSSATFYLWELWSHLFNFSAFLFPWVQNRDDKNNSIS